MDEQYFRSEEERARIRKIEEERRNAMERWKFFLKEEGASGDFLNGFEFGAMQFEKATQTIQESNNAF